MAQPAAYYRDGRSTPPESRCDAKGRYRAAKGDAIADRFEVLHVLGAGAFGTVFCARDHKHRRNVALKIVRKLPQFRRQAAQEVTVLAKLGSIAIPEVVRMFGAFTFHDHTCIVMELLGINLYQLMRARNHQGFDADDPRLPRIARDVAAGLEALRKAGVVHADLKPENVALAPSGGFKIIDLGNSMPIDRARKHAYVQSRYYRCPEAILRAAGGISYPADMWSLGCILFEVHTGAPLFAGKSESQMAGLIEHVLGPPPHDVLNSCARGHQYFVIEGGQARARWPQVSQHAGFERSWPCEPLTDFVMRCLRWQPGDRLLPCEAVEHAYVAQNLRSSRRTTLL